MASEEHKALAQYIKEVHSSLRKASSTVGAKQAWEDHCKKKDMLVTYAQCMEKLATTHWTYGTRESAPTSRIQWTAEMCHNYFTNKSYIRLREREIDIASKINLTLTIEECFSEPIKLIDVGSCYNPFTMYDFLDVFAIDLCPANSSVLKCDFLNVSVGSSNIHTDSIVTQLQQCYFDAVTFCFFLEYVPSSELRINACEKAYNILKPGGLLIVNTPDSKHVGANSKLMKCWRYALSHIGFTRIKYEKFQHMHCMAFRKALRKEIAERWAVIHREPYMERAIHIPQDFHHNDECMKSTKIEISSEDFKELPFCDILDIRPI